MIKNLDLKDKRVLLRVDYNVPVQDGQVMDDYRIKKSLQTIRYCIDQGSSITIMSHLGRPEGFNEEYSLRPISEELSNILGKEIIFSEDCVSDKSFMVSSGLESGQIHMLENLRFH